MGELPEPLLQKLFLLQTEQPGVLAPSPSAMVKLQSAGSEVFQGSLETLVLPLLRW